MHCYQPSLDVHNEWYAPSLLTAPNHAASFMLVQTQLTGVMAVPHVVTRQLAYANNKRTS